jgi:TonB-dependent SusC/RagA subfamily outer membrane receptor
MRPLFAIRHRIRWSRVSLLALTMAAGGGCHHSARDVATPVPVDTLGHGYTTSARNHRSGAVQSLGPAELARLRVRRVEELLIGRVAGVQVLSTPNGGFMIRVRGVTTINGYAEPLYIIDGMPVTVVPGQGLNWLNPAEIFQIEVLKDPAETSMYGARGANGVIVIRTKRGPDR